jgi:hypothetical protein
VIATVANSVWFASCLPEYRRFRRALGRVREEQERVLFGILGRNAASTFGRAHGFAEIRSVREYQERVPLRDFEAYRANVMRIADGERSVLTEEPVRLFEPTSGSAGASKWIPYTDSLQREFQRGIRAWVSGMFLTDPLLMNGSAYWAVSPVQEPTMVTAAGIRVGFADDTEYVGGMQRRIVQAVMAVPSSVRGIRDMDEFWDTTLELLSRRRDLRFISVWSPSFLRLLMERSKATAEELWPRLRVISCWKDGNSAAGSRALAAMFPHARIAGKGLIATEGFVSLPWPGCAGAVLAVRSHFLEFLPVGGEVPQLAHALDVGQEYSVVLTTGGGLYRYDLGDVVRVTGRVGQCPVVTFVGRKHVVDWRGEKLHEAHVARVLSSTFAREGIDPEFSMLAFDGGG